MAEKNEISLQIIGHLVACESGYKDSWRGVADWLADKLNPQYGEKVRVQYFDLFDPDCPSLPPNAQLPVVLINGALLSSGTKVSIPLIRKKIEELI